MRVRDATPGDIPAVTEIYAHHVLHGTGTFEEEPPDAAEMAARIAKVQAAGFAWLVAEGEGDAEAEGGAGRGLVLGYGYYAPFRDRSAYRFCAEDSIYVREDVRGQGVGKALVQALLAHAQARGIRQMLAVIGDSENAGSIGLHASLGFRQAGVIRAVGLKFGRWLDVVTMQKALGEGDRDVPRTS